MRNKKGWWLTSMIARVLMLLAAALLFLSYASMVVNPAKAWYMTALGLMFVPIAALNFFLLVWAIRRKSGPPYSSSGPSALTDIHWKILPVLLRRRGSQGRSRETGFLQCGTVRHG